MSIVYWSQTGNRKEFVRAVLEAFESEIGCAHSFLVKPNLVSSEPYPTTTHPQTLGAVLELLVGKSVVVGDAPAVDAGRSKKIVQSSALRRVCDSHGVPIINLYETKVKKFASHRGYKLHLFALPLEVDFVISLPVLKIHNQCLMTGALKNQFGYLTRKERVLMHLGIRDINKGIAELNVVAKPHLIIVDAVQSLSSAQEVRHGGTKEDVGCMFAGSDPVSLDCFGLELLQEVEPRLQGKSPEDIPQIGYALDYHVGSNHFKAVQIVV